MEEEDINKIMNKEPEVVEPKIMETITEPKAVEPPEIAFMED
jgi:hypothetical protein